MKNTFASISKNAARRVWRQRSFWIIQGLLSLLPVLIAVAGYLAGPNFPFISRVATPPGLSLLVLHFLVLPLLVSRPVLEDYGKTGELLWSTPLDHLAYFAGLFTGLWAALLIGSLIQLGGWFLGSLFWNELLADWSWFFSLAVHLLVNTLGLSLIFLFATLIRRSLQLMFFWAALWLGLFFNIYFRAALEEAFFAISSIAFTNIFFTNLVLSPSLGLGLARDQVMGMFAWFMGVSLAAFSLALLLALRIDDRRATRKEWLPLGLAGLSLLAGVGGFTLNSRAVANHAIPPSPYSIQLNQWEVLSQETEIEVDAGRGTLAGRTRMILAQPQAVKQPEIVLRLNPGLALTEARGADAAPLAHHRVGDSVIISLGAVPASPVVLVLAWQGSLYIPYTAYEQKWQHPEAPYGWAFVRMPTALGAFIQPEGGFLLRDGDWKPWPWTTDRHQAQESRLTIRARGGEAVGSAQVQDGEAVWEGALPDGLMAFLPGKRVESRGMILAASPYTKRMHLQQAALFGAEADQIAALFDAPAPRYVVVAPYLSEVVWSGDLLLVPDGSGYYLSRSLSWLYQNDINGPQQMENRRATRMAATRAYILEGVPVTETAVEPVLGQALDRRTVDMTTLSEQAWQEDNGHWVLAVETPDVLVRWTPRRSISLGPQGKWSSIAFWLAIEMSDETLRQADLDELNSLHEKAAASRSYRREDRERALERMWPSVWETLEAREIVLALHAWTEAVGREEALSLFAAAFEETQPETVEELFKELELRSGQQIIEELP
jgi:hypothetical protein